MPGFLALVSAGDGEDEDPARASFDNRLTREKRLTSRSKMKLNVTIGHDGWDGSVSYTSGARARSFGRRVHGMEGKS